MKATVKFVGGPLDGELREMPELPPRYRAAQLTPPRRVFSPNLRPDEAAPLRTTEYVLTRKDNFWYYVESELLKLSEAEGVDPRPAEG